MINSNNGLHIERERRDESDQQGITETDLAIDAEIQKYKTAEDIINTALAMLWHASHQIHLLQENSGEPCTCGAVWAEIISTRFAALAFKGGPASVVNLLRAAAIGLFCAVPDHVKEINEIESPASILALEHALMQEMIDNDPESLDSFDKMRETTLMMLQFQAMLEQLPVLGEEGEQPII